MKKNNSGAIESPIEVLIEVYDFWQAAILLHHGHHIHSISEEDKNKKQYIYRFYLRSDTLTLIDACETNSLEVEPFSFICSIVDVLLRKVSYTGECCKEIEAKKHGKKGLDKGV